MRKKLLSYNLTSKASDADSLSVRFENIDFYFSGFIYKYNNNTVEESELESIFYSISRLWESGDDGGLKDIINSIDGEFIFNIFNRNESKSVIISDRFGLASLYFKNVDGFISGWSNSIDKLICSDVDFSDINIEAIKAFISTSSFLSATTIFNNIVRVGPASIIDIDTNTGKVIKKSFYWTWKSINSSAISFDDAVDTLYKLFSTAIRKRIIKGRKYSFTLSGGLDSRAILAEAVKHIPQEDIKCFTFGKLGSPDLKIADTVTSIAGVLHVVDEINSSNWTDGRDAGVFRTGGMKNFLHMHGVDTIDTISTHSPWVFNGFCGDLVLGGGYLDKRFGSYKNGRTLAEEKYGIYSKLINFDDEYYDVDKSDSIFIYNRGVRFTSMGLEVVSHKSFGIKPFMDNDLIDFIYSLPCDYLYEGKLYHTMLLKYYPDYFSNIPWQKTGTPISPVLSNFHFSTMNKILKKRLISIIKGTTFESGIRKIYQKIKGNDTFVNYSDWVNDKDFLRVLSVLFNGNSICENLLGPEFVEKILSEAKCNSNVERLGCLISIEKYLSSLKCK